VSWMEWFKATGDLIRLVLSIWLALRVFRHCLLIDNESAPISPKWMRGTLILIVLVIR
jgi:hypothetical protein